MTEQQPQYRIEESAVVEYGEQRPVYRIVRSDGTQDKRLADTTFYRRETAATYREFYERTPAGCYLKRAQHSGRQFGRQGWYWQVYTLIEDDPTDMKYTWDDSTPVPDTYPEGTRVLDILISMAVAHAERAPQRITEAANKKAVAEAEAAVREARTTQLAALRRVRGELATPRQVDYILQLLASRTHTGEGDGFFSGPTDRAAIEEMSKADASAYIASLKGDY